MRRAAFAILTIMAPITPATGQERDEVFKQAAVYIVTAHECSKIGGITPSVEDAARTSRERMLEAGYTPDKADQSISEIMSNLTDRPTRVTAPLCRSLLSSMGN